MTYAKPSKAKLKKMNEMSTSNQTEAEKDAEFEMSERYKRGRALIDDMVKNGGFTKKQAAYLVNLLDEYLPIT